MNYSDQIIRSQIIRSSVPTTNVPTTKTLKLSPKMVRCGIVLLLLACVTNALIVPRAPSVMRMRSRIMSTPTEGGVDFDAPISAAIAVGNVVKEGEGGAGFTQPVLDDCEVDDPRPEVRMHLFTDSVCFCSPPFIVAPTVHRHRRSTLCTHGCGKCRRISR